MFLLNSNDWPGLITYSNCQKSLGDLTMWAWPCPRDKICASLLTFTRLPQTAEQWYSLMIILMINCEIYLGVGTPIYIIKAPKEKKKIKNLSRIPQGTHVLQRGRGELESQAQHFLKWLCINSACVLQTIYIFSTWDGREVITLLKGFHQFAQRQCWRSFNAHSALFFFIHCWKASNEI